MCRNIKPLFNFEPPATEDEVENAARQFVRKISAMPAPTGQNQTACDRAVNEISDVVQRLFEQLTTTSAPKNREVEAARARERSARRFAAKS